MSDVDVDQLIGRIERLPDGDIIKALATPGEYSLEAMVIYESEAKRRGIQPEAVRPIALREEQRRKDQLAVTRSFKGIGETLYGMRSFRPDGSYQATKWFIFLYLPIYPIASFRLRPDEKGRNSVVEVLPIDRRQVIDTYCFVVVGWASLVACFRLFENYSGPYGELVSAAPLGLPLLFLYFVRRRARRGSGRNEAGGDPPIPP